MQEYKNIFHKIINTGFRLDTKATVRIEKQFDPENVTDAGIMKNLNAAFFIGLAGDSHHLYKVALNYLREKEANTAWQESSQFYLNALTSIHDEFKTAIETDKDFADTLSKISQEISHIDDEHTLREKLWSVFHPEAVFSADQSSSNIERFRKKRVVRVTTPNSSPVTSVADELLFTSNILLGLPHVSETLETLPVSDKVRDKLRKVMKEEQSFWYDHPIQIGTSVSANEAIYGMQGLNDTVEFEKTRGNIKEEERVPCVLSVSVTHKGLHTLAKDYLEEEFAKATPTPGLDIYVFTEEETKQLINEVLIPACAHYDLRGEIEVLEKVFGVDGEYGRHYSFLKAISALWKVLINPALKGTFKIDLDQVFPQDKLVAQSGRSAFEHFKTTLWGAQGKDSDGNKVELGMIAGALVNEKDIGKSLFTPDVTFPSSVSGLENCFFFSKQPMAFSTEAELMTRYQHGEVPDGIEHCLQRIHVTGGTNGILVDSLRKYRPFTPSFIGRAEDQCYIMSVLYQAGDINLRYLHEDGLIMRHDKEAFAGEAIKAAELGRQIGDLYRILYFSYYANALPWPFKKTKEITNPFTGSFITSIPKTLIYLRFASSLAENFMISPDKASLLFETGIDRLSSLFKDVTSVSLKQQYESEKSGWDLYYDILNAIEVALEKEDGFALDLKHKAKNVFDKSLIKSHIETEE
ncbi:MAG: hypothetical protein HQK83_07780 [Fibrobacteria bacterium]|nr:hypothetical protein [Fibrobacteria bacterium]